VGASPGSWSLPPETTLPAEEGWQGLRETLVIRGATGDAVISGQRKLVIEVVLRLRGTAEVKVRALIDTGSEVNLVRQGLLPPTLPQKE